MSEANYKVLTHQARQETNIELDRLTTVAALYVEATRSSASCVFTVRLLSFTAVAKWDETRQKWGWWWRGGGGWDRILGWGGSGGGTVDLKEIPDDSVQTKSRKSVTQNSQTLGS